MTDRAHPGGDVVAEEARFILANVLTEGRFGRNNRLADIERLCAPAVSLPFRRYVAFLSGAGYLTHDRKSDVLDVTSAGEKVVTSGQLQELMERAMKHFDDDPSGSPRGRPAPPPFRQPTPSSSPLAPPSLDADSLASAARKASPRKKETELPARGGGHRYIKEDAIGSGGLGKVYRARQRSLDRLVALKEIRDVSGVFGEDLRSEIGRRFGEVVQSVAGLSHPNILAIHDAAFDSEHPYLVTELMKRGSLRRVIDDAEEIPVGLVVSLVAQALQALRAAHAVGIWHRGLKPENLLLDEYGNLKVSDFGMARIVEREPRQGQPLFVGAVSVAYMASELLQNPSAASAQTDLYALGIIFYELITRRLPGRRSPMPSQVDKRCPKGLDDVFDRMTTDDMAARYASAEKVLDDLARVEGVDGRNLFAYRDPIEKLAFRATAEDSVKAADAADTADEADAVDEDEIVESRDATQVTNKKK